VLEALGATRPGDVGERDAILARLKIERLPKPHLGDGRPLNAEVRVPRKACGDVDRQHDVEPDPVAQVEDALA